MMAMQLLCCLRDWMTGISGQGAVVMFDDLIDGMLRSRTVGGVVRAATALMKVDA